MAGSSSQPEGESDQPNPDRQTLAPTLLNTQEFGLPRFSFNQDGHLHSVNHAAREMIGPDGAFARERIDVLFPTKSHRTTTSNQTINLDRWIALADKCKTKLWGEGVVIEYTLPGVLVPKRAEATVVVHPPTDSLPNGFSVLLTRQLPNLLPEFDNLNFDSPPSEAELDQSTIEYAVAGLSRGLMSGTRSQGSSLASVDAEGFGTKVLSMAELIQLVDEFPQVSHQPRPFAARSRLTIFPWFRHRSVSPRGRTDSLTG